MIKKTLLYAFCVVSIISFSFSISLTEEIDLILYNNKQRIATTKRIKDTFNTNGN